MGIFDIGLNNINLDDTNHDVDDPDTIILVRFLTWHIKFEKHEALKKELNEELIDANFSYQKVRKKEIELIFTE